MDDAIATLKGFVDTGGAGDVDDVERACAAVAELERRSRIEALRDKHLRDLRQQGKTEGLEHAMCSPAADGAQNHVVSGLTYAGFPVSEEGYGPDYHTACENCLRKLGVAP